MRYGLNITGILGILKTAKMLGLISTVKPILEALVQQAGFWVVQTLYERVLEDVGE
jgi:predicted nucleic acid-binding protein